jgi:hypothetical protein
MLLRWCGDRDKLLGFALKRVVNHLMHIKRLQLLTSNVLLIACNGAFFFSS